MAIKECQHQFKYRKWNCTTINKKNEPVFGNALNKGKTNKNLRLVVAADEVKTNVFTVHFGKDCL